MTDVPRFVTDIEESASALGLEIWRGIPIDAPRTPFPNGTSPVEICETAVRLGANLIYVDAHGGHGGAPGAAVAGFAVAGVLHYLDVADGDVEEGAWDAGDAWLPPHLRELAEVVAKDSEFDPHSTDRGMRVLEAVCGHLDWTEFQLVRTAATDLFYEVGDALDTKAERLALKLIGHPELDPLLDWNEWAGWVEEFAADEGDSRVRDRAAPVLARLVEDRGLKEAARREIQSVAAERVSDLPPVVRDRLGFTSRNAARSSLLEPYLSDVDDAMKERLPYWMSAAEWEQYGLEREARYSTAAQVLVDDLGESKAAASRALGISASVIDRIVREHPERVSFAPDDPLLDLEQRLRG